jgi:hypothetical protein
VHSSNPPSSSNNNSSHSNHLGQSHSSTRNNLCSSQEEQMVDLVLPHSSHQITRSTNTRGTGQVQLPSLLQLHNLLVKHPHHLRKELSVWQTY